MNKISKVFFEKRREYARKYISKYENLDIGSSNYPISDNSISLDIRKEKKPNVVADTRFLPFRPNAFHSISILEVLEHFTTKDKQKIIKEISRVCIGRVVISIPNHSLFMDMPQKIIWELRELTTQREYHNSKFTHAHIGCMSPSQFEEFLIQNGVKCIQKKRIMLYDYVFVCNI